ncbi:MAG: EamA family transporter [Hyphomicrobiales bacterium]|nr:MAG: EamA family transporter [Hyphomicrobiales bacterium]
MMEYQLAALAAATCWALTGMISTGPAGHLGAIAFNRLRMAMVFVLLAGVTIVSGSWATITGNEMLPILASGFVGIFLGDTALFLTLNRLGPRRTGILFAMNAPMSTVLGWIFLGEALPLQTVTGIVTAIAGVVLAIVFGKRRSQLHQWENIQGPLWVGVLLGLAAALSQSVGSLIARPVMAAGADPIAVSALRVGVAVIGLSLLMQLPVKRFHQRNPLTWSVARTVAISGFIGMGVGMTLLLFALSGGEVGIIATLSATTPAIILPLLWWRTGERPALGAWFGAALVVIGTALIFLE